MKSGLKEPPNFVTGSKSKVSPVAAMKSGLKGAANNRGSHRDNVSPVAAMKSGLKVTQFFEDYRNAIVSPVAAMKSGLKDLVIIGIRYDRRRFTRCRDEKRTESEGSGALVETGEEFHPLPR